MKKLLCMLLCAMLLPVCALAEDSAANALTLQELNDWAATYIARAMAAEPVNTPADHLTAEGYEFLYDFGAVYADTPDLGADSVISSVVVTSMEAAAPRNVNVGSGLYVVLDAYYNENPQLLGSDESAVLYTLALSAKMNHLNFFDYLTDILDRTATWQPNTPLEKYRNLLPDRWQPSTED